jgi:GNAT superfamily N-acetyltransferase
MYHDLKMESMMKYISRSYDEEEDGFEGNYEGYCIDTSKENLKNWLEKEIGDDGKIYQAIANEVRTIFVLKNLNIDSEYQGQGYGAQILEDAMDEAQGEYEAIILLCDVGEIQKEGFILEKFYANHDFKTIGYFNDYPLMVSPEEVGEKIAQKMQIKKMKP